MSRREVWVVEMRDPLDHVSLWTSDEGHAHRSTASDYADEQNQILSETGRGMEYRVVRYVPAKSAPKRKRKKR